MGHIKEPKGIDFVIKGRSLTREEEKIISEIIKSDKEKKSSSLNLRAGKKRRTIKAKRKLAA